MHLTFFNNRKELLKVSHFLKVSQCKLKQKKNNFKARKPPQKQVKIHQIKNWFPLLFPRKMSHGFAIFQVKDKCTSLVGS
jgi:hypothetical protein